MMKRINWLFLICSLFIVVSCKKNNGTRDENVGGGVEKPNETIYKPNTTVYGSNKYVKFVVGDANSPIILASPHDGTITPANMPVRDHADAVTVRDLNLKDLTEEISNALYTKIGIRPHVIVNDVARSRMEPNRALNETYHKSEAANALWREYHAFLKGARDMVQKNVGKGLFLDMHGHGHTKQRIEVGYLVSKANLNATEAILNGVSATSSIYHIANNSSLNFSNLIRGDYAFGTLLANEGLPSVPSKQDIMPGSDEYFNGGYCTLAYGSKNGGSVSAIQLECNSVSRNSATVRKESANKIANAIIQYMKVHHNLFLDK